MKLLKIKYKNTVLPKDLFHNYIDKKISLEHLLNEFCDIGYFSIFYFVSDQIKYNRIKNKIEAIRFVSPTKNLNLLAVSENPQAIQFIKKPTQEMKLIAIRKNPYSIQYMKRPSEKLQLEAIKLNINCYCYISYPAQKAYEFYMYKLKLKYSS